MNQFDKHAVAYDAVRARISYPEVLYRFLAEKCAMTSAALDLGCGNGVSTVRLLPYFDYVEGSDMGANLIDKAKTNYPGCNFSVSAAEEYESQRKFDLVTSATAFYWMDRDVVLQKVKLLLNDGGVFCAYKYDFPIVYGALRNYIEQELVTKWHPYRDARLTAYDDTVELIRSVGGFCSVDRHVFPNIIDLTPVEIGLFFLSTSYVTKYMDAEEHETYAEEFMANLRMLNVNEIVRVNFDIHAIIAHRDPESVKSGSRSKW